MSNKRCKDCGHEYPETREYFGQYRNVRNGQVKVGFRNSCRRCMAQRTRQHSEDNPQLVRARGERRRQREASASGDFSGADIQNIRRQLDDRCRYCGTPLEGEGEVDHLTPISRGGSNDASNLTLACLRCNREKGSKTFDEYLEWRRERDLKTRIDLRGDLDAAGVNDTESRVDDRYPKADAHRIQVDDDTTMQRDTPNTNTPGRDHRFETPVLGGEWHPVISSNIGDVRYDQLRRHLDVRFKTGATYRYRRVPQDIAAGLFSAPSPGRYLHLLIRDKFEYEKL